jgi:ABC-type anion transport system duplicated permease subunit
MKFVFSIGPWLMELFNPPPRDSLTIVQKIGRVFLVLATLVTICIISALLISLGLLVLQRSREALLGVPQLLNILVILAVSAVVNIVCIRTLFEIRRLDRLLIPHQEKTVEVEIPLPARERAAGQAKS